MKESKRPSHVKGWRLSFTNSFSTVQNGQEQCHFYYCGNKQISDEDMPDFARAVQKNEKNSRSKEHRIYVMIYLYENSIGNIGCQALSQMNIHHLRQMYLGWNSISPQGCKFLSSAPWTHLQKLFLYGNNVQDLGIKHLSKAQWPSLKELCLSQNHIHDEGFTQLLKVESINLSSIYISMFMYNKLTITFQLRGVGSSQRIVGQTQLKQIQKIIKSVKKAGNIYQLQSARSYVIRNSCLTPTIILDYRYVTVETDCKRR